MPQPFDEKIARKNRDLLDEARCILEEAEQQNQVAINGFLERSGWTKHCDLPGSFWLWRKVIGGREINVGQSVAVTIESDIQDFDFLEDDE